MDQFIKDCIGWDVANWSQALKFWDQNANLPDKPLKCLELGARNGGLSLWLARKGYHVLCSDVEDPESNASPLHKRYKVSNQIDYQSIDATDIPYENQFDIVIFKSMMGAVGWKGRDDLQTKCMNEIYKCLKPGGQLLFAENLKATAMHQFFRHKFARWSKSWNYLEISKMDSLLSEFHDFAYQTTGFTGLLGGNEAQRKVFGALDQSIFQHTVPQQYRYIIFCIANK